MRVCGRNAQYGIAGCASQWLLLECLYPGSISKSMVHRWFQLFHLQPHRQRHFKISNDPLFVDKVHDIVGLGASEKARIRHQ